MPSCSWASSSPTACSTPPPAATHEIVLELVIGLDEVRVVVTDGGSSTVPMIQPLDTTRPGGRGLFLVDTPERPLGHDARRHPRDAGLVRDGPPGRRWRRLTRRPASARSSRRPASCAKMRRWAFWPSGAIRSRRCSASCCDAVAIGPRGCEGDRRWIVVDAATGERIANKRGPTDPRLRACRAELLDALRRAPAPAHHAARRQHARGRRDRSGALRTARAPRAPRALRHAGRRALRHDRGLPRPRADPPHHHGHAGAPARRGPRFGLGRPALSPQPRARRRPRRRALRARTRCWAAACRPRPDSN